MNGAATRARRVFGALLLLLSLLILHAGWIQIVRGNELRDRARRQHFRVVTVPAPRGRILDRNGRILAASYHACSVAVNPQEIEDASTFATRLAFLLNDAPSAPALAARIGERRQAGVRFAYLRRWIDRDMAALIRKAGLPGIDMREEPRRECPHGAAAAALIGLVGDEGGLCGLERRFDDRLRGTAGSCSVFRAGGGRHLYLYPERDQPPHRGADLRTTIEIVLQHVVEDALRALQERFLPKTSCALVMDPHTGEILALAGQPSFDARADRTAGVLERLRIPAVQNAYPVGSVMKPLIVARALSSGAVHPQQTFDCGRGHRFFGGRLLHDVKPNGVLDLEHVLIKSSNIGMAQVGLALGIDDAYAFLKSLGFGAPTGVEVSGEQAGHITALDKWSETYTLVSVSMGREMSVTPVQLLAAYSALINGGRLWRPTLLHGAPRREPRRVDLSPRAMAFVRAAMEKVVSEGTGRRARIRGLRVAGKTGTAKIELKGKKPKYISSFVGFAPAEDPQMIVLVVADDPQAVDGLKPYGGTVAAPAVREILRRGLPLVRANSASPESGVRQRKYAEGKVRVAAVHWSSVKAGERISPATGRNPDSADVEPCRSDR